MKIFWLVLTLLASANGLADPQMGNGQRNWIVVDDFVQDKDSLSFSEIRSAENGWLVIHAVNDGIPDGDQYLGSTYLSKGIHRDVSITVYRGITPGESLLVMLHRDTVPNQSFDFVHLHDGDVVDRAVFEDTKLIGHIITTR